MSFRGRDANGNPQIEVQQEFTTDRGRVVQAIDSIYRWQGEVHAGPEWRVLFKTRPDAAPALVAAIRARHPYQLPAIHAITKHMKASTGTPRYRSELSSVGWS